MFIMLKDKSKDRITLNVNNIISMCENSNRGKDVILTMEDGYKIEITREQFQNIIDKLYERDALIFVPRQRK